MVLKLPELRAEVISTIAALADRAYQQRVWIDHDPPPGYTRETYYDSFDLAVHVLYDDAKLDKNPESAVGDILRNEEEVRVVKALIVKIDEVLASIGRKGTDVDYVNSEGWPAVIEAAKSALKAINS